jgi:autotransporter strand-loop-strand O-heptosyltransferase
MGNLRFFDLSKYKADIFVETGTGMGIGLLEALKYGFDAYYSCEIEHPLYRMSVNRFSSLPVNLFNMDSLHFLAEILPIIPKEKRIVFWLDAHFPGADYLNQERSGDNNEINLPLVHEIALIHKYRQGCKDTILIDDLRLLKPYEKEKLEEMGLFLKYPGLDFLDCFKETHFIREHCVDEGYVEITPKESIIKAEYNFLDGPFVSIQAGMGKYHVSFRDVTKDEIVYQVDLGVGQWAQCDRKWYTQWEIIVTDEDNKSVIFTNDLKDKDVHIHFKSYSLGDTIAWAPYVEEFRKKHGCRVFCSTNWNSLLIGAYPEINFIEHESFVPVFAKYVINIWHLLVNWRSVGVQQYASYALGLPPEEIRAKVNEKYVCIGEFSTSETKQWQYPGGWQIVADYLNSLGYTVISVAWEGTKLKNVVDAGNNKIEAASAILKGCEFFIGVASGLSWLAWSLGKKVVMISGFSSPMCEFQQDNYRIAGQGSCVGCYNDTSIPNGNSRPCPNGCQCSKLITPELVLEKINELRGSRKMTSETSKARLLLSKFCLGYGIDIGMGGDKIVPHAIGIDLPSPYTNVGMDAIQLGGDGRNLKWFADETLDFVYSSHLLEDFINTGEVLSEWARVLKKDGLLILLLPDEQVYRKYCRDRGQGTNEHHQIENFSAEYVKTCMDLKCIYESGIINDYSFALVFRK